MKMTLRDAAYSAVNRHWFGIEQVTSFKVRPESVDDLIKALEEAVLNHGMR